MAIDKRGKYRPLDTEVIVLLQEILNTLRGNLNVVTYARDADNLGVYTDVLGRYDTDGNFALLTNVTNYAGFIDGKWNSGTDDWDSTNMNWDQN